MSSCRICYHEENETEETLIESPCACLGSMSHVHISCLNSGICGVCHERFWHKLPIDVRVKRVGAFLYKYMMMLSTAVIPVACTSYMWDRENFALSFAKDLGYAFYGLSLLRNPYLGCLSLVIPSRLWATGLILLIVGSLDMFYRMIRYGECKL
jgi:hypothetical protein